MQRGPSFDGEFTRGETGQDSISRASSGARHLTSSASVSGPLRRQIASVRASRMTGIRAWTGPTRAFASVVTRAKLSTAALETLAIVAYRQPVSRAQIAAIRGVSVDSVVRTLMMRGLIAEVGDRSSGAVLYGTTPFFLEIMGMNTLEELEPLAPLVPDLSELDETEQELR